MEDKIKKARESGYSDEEINSFLQKKGLDISTTKPKNILETILSKASDIFPQTSKMYQEGIQSASGGINKLTGGKYGTAITPEQATQNYQDVKNRTPKAFGELAQYIPVTGANPLMALLSGGLRGATHGVAQENATPQSVATSALTTAPIEASLVALTKILPFLTKKGVVGKTEKAVEEATKAGKGNTFDELINTAREEVKKKLGWTKEVRESFNSTIVEKTPASIEPGAGKFTPKEMLDWRRQIQSRQGSGIFQFLQKGGDIQGKVDSVIRNTISENLHKLAPESKIPDWLYSAYRKGGPIVSGDVPTKALKIGAAALVGRQIPYLLQRILGGALQIPQ